MNTDSDMYMCFNSVHYFSVVCNISHYGTNGLPMHTPASCVLGLNKFFGGFYFYVWKWLQIGFWIQLTSIVWHAALFGNRWCQKYYLIGEFYMLFMFILNHDIRISLDFVQCTN